MFRKMMIAAVAFSAMTASGLNSANAFNFGTYGRSVERSHNGAYAPIAFRIFCRTNPRECASSNDTVAQYTGRTALLLHSVNSSVNRSIRPRLEQRDSWTVNPTYGDCDDYALTKRSRLIHAGIPSGALRMASVITSGGESHEVLVVKTTRGEFVLDNLRNSIVQRQQTGYRFVKMSGANPLKWIR
jgi:predicted transglutaminase-like cysteine proteinase